MSRRLLDTLRFWRRFDSPHLANTAITDARHSLDKPRLVWFLAERLGAMAPPQSVLLSMVAMQVLTALCLFLLPTPEPVQRTRHILRIRPWDLLRTSGYFRQLSLLVLAGTFSSIYIA